MRSCDVFKASAASASVLNTRPSDSLTRTFFDVLRACASMSTHRQFSGEYGPSLSIRSIVRLAAKPFASAQSTKDHGSSHSLQTTIPRSAYRFRQTEFGVFGSHRRRIPSHRKYAGWSLSLSPFRVARDGPCSRKVADRAQVAHMPPVFLNVSARMARTIPQSGHSATTVLRVFASFWHCLQTFLRPFVTRPDGSVFLNVAKSVSAFVAPHCLHVCMVLSRSIMV